MFQFKTIRADFGMVRVLSSCLGLLSAAFLFFVG